MLGAALCLMLGAGPLRAHEFWVEPLAFVVALGETVKADLRIGQDFGGSRYPYLSRRFQDFTMASGADSEPVPGTEGDLPAVAVEPAPGLLVLAYHSEPDQLTFRDFEKFASYVAYEGLDWAVDRHRADGLPETDFRERYTRNAKALVQVGANGGGEDQMMGLPFELTVDGSPYAPGTAAVAVTLTWRGRPVADWPINVFTRTDGVVKTQVRTDAQGRAEVPFPPASDVLLNAVYLQRTDADGFAWESWWASTTFGRVGRDG